MDRLKREILDGESRNIAANANVVLGIHSTRPWGQTLLDSLRRLSAAAAARDSVMGDQCALMAAQAELRSANKQACDAIKELSVFAQAEKQAETGGAEHSSITLDRSVVQRAHQALVQLYQRAASLETQELTNQELSHLAREESTPSEVVEQGREVVWIRSTISLLSSVLEQQGKSMTQTEIVRLPPDDTDGGAL